MNHPVLINGKNYDWSNIDFVPLGLPIIGITEINFSKKKSKKNNYGAGNEPVGRGYGNVEYEGDVTIYIEEVHALELAAPNGNILDIPPFTVTVSYSGLGVVPKVEKLRNLEFTERNFSTKQGDTMIAVKIPFIFAGLD